MSPYAIRVACHSDGEFGQQLKREASPAAVRVEAERQHRDALENARRQLAEVRAAT